MPKSVLEEAASFIVENNTDSVFVIGMSYPFIPRLQRINKSQKLEKKWNRYAMYASSLLGFEFTTKELNEPLTVSLIMWGTSNGVKFPHYQFFLNTSLIGSGFVTGKDSVYTFSIQNNSVDTTLHLIINYDNDKMSPTGDRNLFISDIQINEQPIDPITVRDYFVLAKLGNYYNLISNEMNIKHYLGDVGYDTSRVKIVQVDYDSFNKTLALAKGAKRHFSHSGIESLNIITTTKHSTRSYLNFKNCLKDYMVVGCIPIHDDIFEDKSLYARLDERGSLLLTWIYWWFH